jgi:hypothetical protein
MENEWFILRTVSDFSFLFSNSDIHIWETINSIPCHCIMYVILALLKFVLFRQMVVESSGGKLKLKVIDQSIFNQPTTHFLTSPSTSTISHHHQPLLSLQQSYFFSTSVSKVLSFMNVIDFLTRLYNNDCNAD